MIGSEQCALGALGKTRVLKPVANRLGHIAELREGVALDRRPSGGDSGGIVLEFDGDQVREAVGRLHEAVVEHSALGSDHRAMNALAYLTRNSCR